jgi:hypothetical protein
MATTKSNFTKGLYEGREPRTFMEKLTVDCRDSFLLHYNQFEGFNPSIHCEESHKEEQ